MNHPQRCRLYLISPPAIDLPQFAEALKNAFSGGDIASFQLRLKDASDGDILIAAKTLLPICREHGAAFIMNDRADLAVQCGADGLHLGQDDLLSFPPPPAGEVGSHGDPGGGDRASIRVPSPPSNSPRKRGENNLAAIRKQVGDAMVIGVSCHDSRHLAMVAGEQGADYVAFGAFYPTTSKSPEKLARYGTPQPDILQWWQEYMVLPCVAIGGINARNCGPLVRAGADFIAAITAVWNHPEGPDKAVEEFNNVILRTAQP